MNTLWFSQRSSGNNPSARSRVELSLSESDEEVRAAAMEDIREGRVVPNEEVTSWLESLDTEDEQDAPEWPRSPGPAPQGGV